MGGHRVEEGWREFRERRDEDLPGLAPLDAETLRFVRSWHKHPAIAEALCKDGLNLGEAIEFDLLQEVVPILLAARAEQP
ncbi:MAG: hypothetical protein K1Y02_06785 [Candidatus Hydrogenedentes bacterium]|nr:hypothetical protein [Candidatus Hydrogenedentota bacterium]